MASNFDFCILGAGLAGMHLAWELSDRGASVCVVDPNGVAAGASGTPVGLANPATGRFASRSWEADLCLTHLSNRLNFVKELSDKNFFRQSGILRPALDFKIASKMQKNLKDDVWEQQIVWLDEDQIQDFHPGIKCVEGGVWVQDGLTVQIPDYLKVIESYLLGQDVTFRIGSDYELNSDQPNELIFNHLENILFDKLIFANGIHSIRNQYWDHLKMHAVKGQTLVMQSASPLSFNHAISALGYISKIDDHTFILGSTYEHNFEHTSPDDWGKEYMIGRLEKVLPKLSSNSHALSAWAGIRASTPDRKPYLGMHHSLQDYYIFAGLGSKGLLYAPYCAFLLANHILDDSPLPTEVSIDRFKSKA